MKKSKWFVLLALFCVTILGCKEDILAPLEKDSVAPQPISNPVSERMAGAVKVSYNLPSDADLMYVMAEYTNKYGKVISVKASSYTNSLTVDGFADTASYNLNLYAIDKSENKSAPVTIKVKALEPPIFAIRRSLVLVTDFGGINISFANPTEANIAVVVTYKDSLGNFATKETIYTKSKSGIFSSRGFPSKETIFGVYIRDRWDNRTDTAKATLTPIFEKELDKSKFKVLTLPTDAPVGWGLPINNLWDKVISAEGNMWHTTDVGMPLHVTFDLGVTAKISRFTLWQRQGVWIYNHGNPKRYEIWGSNNPASDGSYTNWTRLASCVSVKPSAQPLGSNSNEDVEAAARGEENNVPLNAAPVRYIRIRVLETWAGPGGQAAHVSEMTFYGNDK
ncbi:DUF4959 domain-containing protein [Pedobacter sp. KBS0701]|uniref:DUF5000 domain-containing lipoprotein n=1 Tax=Pedobacter sp. KBS0701 TaxID=2578106 RepID=UPI00110F32B2|nr:DUF5000 domain-containing lipoprotein [Pedobacter sp. KBS0701]QDW23938.1 DUF4959 domain-containing protein [Pedobacter sp. KBS0701]